MPTYQYACTNPEGKHEFEVVQSFTDAPVTECPECGAAVRKVYGSIGVVFKGSGFYRTDSRTAASAEKSSSTEGASKDGAAKERSSSSSKEGSSSAKDGGSSAKTPATSGSTSAGSAAKAAG